MDEWNDELNKLEDKFRSFENKISGIKKKKNEMDLSAPKIEEEWIKRMKKNNNNFLSEGQESAKDRKKSIFQMDFNDNSKLLQRKTDIKHDKIDDKRIREITN